MIPNRTDPVITVQSSNVELTDELRQRANDRLTKVAGKYFGHLSTASVHFGREGLSCRCTVNIQMGGLDPVTGTALDGDCGQAFEGALDRAAKQLRRRKRELRDDKPYGAGKDALLRQGGRG